MTAAALRRQQGELPAGSLALEQPALVEAVGSFAPELDRLGADAESAPILGAGRSGFLDFGQVGEASADLVEVVDRLSLTRDDRLQLVSGVALGEELLGQRALGQRRLPADVNLPAQRRPMKEQSDPRVGLDLAGLAGPQGRGENERVALDALQRHRAGGGPTVGAGSRKRHRRGRREPGLPCFVEPSAKNCERVGDDGDLLHPEIISTIRVIIPIWMTARPKRETRPERQARTRAELLAASAKVFARRGYSGASVEEIAEQAGYSHGAVYSNFDGKADLFLAVFEEYMAERARELAATQLAIDEDAPLEARARALADQWMERFERDRESFVLHMEFIAHAGRDPELAGRFGIRSATMREAISAYISQYQDEAGVELRLPPDDLALVLRALGIGLAVEALVAPGAVRQDLYGDFVELLVSLLRADPAESAGSREAKAKA
jgi:AcrR family transcriptional regulator